MLVTLIGNNKMYKITLPENVEGDYWISDNSGNEGTKLVNIRSLNGQWVINSNKYSKIINEKYVKVNEESILVQPGNDIVVKRVELKNYCKYYISPKSSEDIYVLFCAPSYEKNVLSFVPKNNEQITIGSGNNNDIVIRDDIVSEYHASISKKNGNWIIDNFDTKIQTYKNHTCIDEDSEIIENGDIIYVCGIKIMIIGNIINIFGPLDKLRVSGKNLTKTSLKSLAPQINEDIDTAEDDVELYSENDYFYNAPRIRDKIEKVSVSIDQPPKREQIAGGAMQFLSMFSTMAMGSVTLVTLISTISTLGNGNTNKTQIVTRIVSSAIMVISMLLIPIVRNVIQKKNSKRTEKRRQVEYKKYINSKILQINKIMDKQSKILKENYMSAEQCERVVLERTVELWERKITDVDFLRINLGVGDTELDIGINRQEPKFSLESDKLLDIYYDVTNQSRTLEDVPITVSLAEHNITSIIGKQEKVMRDYMENIVLQLIALQNYRDLKLVFFVKDELKWNYVKLLPHVWDDTKQMRFFGTNDNDIKQISQFLEEIMNERYGDKSDGSTIVISRKEKDYKQFDSYYLIITDDYRNMKNIRIINRVLGSQENLGFGLLCVTDDITQLPNECKMFIEIKENGKSLVFEDEISSSTKSEFSIDKFEKFDYSKISKVMSNIPIKYTSAKATSLPDHYNFLEMFNSGNIGQLNILDRWNSNDSTISLQAQVGIDATGAPIYLDAHEKYHGPHGLIAGTTGSGKSEFIITYILSLAINFHPDDVTFVLIDYKGGGLAGAFKKKNVQLPHLVGTITNIDSVGLQRSLESIQSELRRRQVMFNEAKNVTNESTIDIYKYQKFYHDGVLKVPISHLFIICDEFAELKQQQSEFMAELMSVSRIGRSLGVHLILATQKPAGIVNDQIRSNSKFGICLKVQDRSDSKDIIKRPDAATLKRAGQFYINVGNDEYFALGQSGYTGVPYVPSDSVKKEQNNFVDFISDIGAVVKRIEDKKVEKKNTKNMGDQLTNIVKYLDQLAEKNNIKENSLWLEPIPENIFIKTIRNKYSVKPEPNVINPIIGEYDDPFNQLQNVLTLNLTEDGNTAIYGSADSGKEMLLTSIVYDTAVTHTSEEVNFYIIDCGSETLRMFRGFPHVGDVLLADDSEKIMRLFKMLKQETRERKQKLLDYNGDYDLYLRTSGEKMPMIVVMINEYGAFSQTYSEYEEQIATISKDCMKYGIVFIISGSTINELRQRLVQNFKKKIALQIIGGDYSYIFNKARRKKPSSYSGRGLVTINDDTVYEFQTTRVCKPENINSFMKTVKAKLCKINKVMAPEVPVLPKVVTLDKVKKDLKDISSVPIGISAKTIKSYCYNFREEIVTLVTAKSIEGTFEFVKNLFIEMDVLETIEPILIDYGSLISKNEMDFVDLFNSMTIRLNNNIEKREDKHIVYFILGLDNFINNLGTEKERFTQNIETAVAIKNCSFIVIDDAGKLRAHFSESWYKKFVAPGNGIYIGNGFDSQFAIAYEADRRDIVSKCGDSMGYVVKKSKPQYLKLLGIEEKGEEDE